MAAGKGALPLLAAVLLLGVCGRLVGGNSDAKRLYDDMMSNYNRLIRPVHNHSEKVMVKLGVRLTQIIEIVSWQTIHTRRWERCMHNDSSSHLRQDLMDQILKTNLWMEHVSGLFQL